MLSLLHLVSSHRSLISIKQEQVDIISPTTYENIRWGISDIYWMMWWKFYFWCKKQDFITWKSHDLIMSDVTYHFDHVTFIFCIILDILNDVWKFLFLFLITLTIPLLSPRNYSFTTFLTSEKIKEILNQWIKVIFSDSVTSH